MNVATTVEIIENSASNGSPDVTTFRIHNPLAKKHWQQILFQLRDQVAVELERWRDAKLKAILPQWAYKHVHSGVKAKAEKAWNYMNKERIEIIHPDGQSLERYIKVKGNIVSVFRIELYSQ